MLQITVNIHLKNKCCAISTCSRLQALVTFFLKTCFSDQYIPMSGQITFYQITKLDRNSVTLADVYLPVTIRCGLVTTY